MQSVVIKRGIGKWDYEEHTKEKCNCSHSGLRRSSHYGWCRSKQPVKETTFPLQAEEPGTEGKQPDVKTDAYDLADTDLTVWYEDPSYEDFLNMQPDSILNRRV